ncbi:hypothetical protein DF022_18550 [Burkholderia cepacia]|nr:hypothetical protein DF022_18550 [Burkholderia cepacia]RQZ68148.1 hypothetical protein DF056_38230 [Burkholderia cepacia]RRA02433.1 hypothetical protein DF055_17535 [Burkholderia cepacia]
MPSTAHHTPHTAHRTPHTAHRTPHTTCRCVDARADGQPRTVSCRTAIAGRATRCHPSATRFRPPPRAGKVAHACQIGLLRENTDPPTTGNS